MNGITGRRVITTAAVAGLLASGTITTATPTTAAAAPAAASASKTVRTARVDIDGDGKRDTTTLRLTSYTKGRGFYTLTTRTAKGRTASTKFVVEDNGDNIEYVWGGVAGVDGVRGAEIRVNPSPVGDAAVFEMYTWRKNMLVKLPAPGAPRSNRYMWVVTNMPWGVQGYTFSTTSRGRFVMKHHLTPYKGKVGRYSGTRTTYRWTSKGWSTFSVRKTGIVSDATAQKYYAGFHGITFID